jgi:hypothetical protein
MADTRDLKSFACKGVRVRLPPRSPISFFAQVVQHSETLSYDSESVGVNPTLRANFSFFNIPSSFKTTTAAPFRATLIKGW